MDNTIVLNNFGGMAKNIYSVERARNGNKLPSDTVSLIDTQNLLEEIHRRLQRDGECRIITQEQGYREGIF